MEDQAKSLMDRIRSMIGGTEDEQAVQKSEGAAAVAKPEATAADEAPAAEAGDSGDGQGDQPETDQGAQEFSDEEIEAAKSELLGLVNESVDSVAGDRFSKLEEQIQLVAKSVLSLSKAIEESREVFKSELAKAAGEPASPEVPVQKSNAAQSEKPGAEDQVSLSKSELAHLREGIGRDDLTVQDIAHYEIHRTLTPAARERLQTYKKQ